jgi:GTP-binding protein of the ras superfamily involved in termination of M-phase
MVPTSKGIQQGESILRLSVVANAQTAIPVLIGTKYDTFAGFPRDEQEEITKQAKRFSKAMHAPLVSVGRQLTLTPQIFCSTSHSINVQKIFKIVLAKAFELKVSDRFAEDANADSQCVIPEIDEVGGPILLYVDV